MEKDGYRKGYHACTTRREGEREVLAARSMESADIRHIGTAIPLLALLSLSLSLSSLLPPPSISYESHTAVADAAQSWRVSIG